MRSVVAVLAAAMVLYAGTPVAGALRLAASGDVGVTPAAEANVDRALATDRQGYLGLGDYHYAASFDSWADMMEPLTSRGAWLTLGNHDNASDVTTMTPNGSTRWSALLGGTLVVGLDTQQRLDAGTSQYNWLKGELARDVPLKVLVLHKPWWLGEDARHPGSEFPGSPSGMDSLARRYGVDLVLAGHEHNYQRAQRTDGITYAIVGTGGHSLYPVQGQAAGTVATCACFGLLRMTLEPSRVQAAFDATEGSVVTKDTFSVKPVREFWAVQAEDASEKTAGGVVVDPAYSKGKAWNLWSNGHLAHQADNAFTRNVTVVIRATGTEAGGVLPRMVAYLDGAQVGAWDVQAGGLAYYKVKVRLPAGSPELRVAFTNDAVIQGEDRNLIVDRLALSG